MDLLTLVNGDLQENCYFLSRPGQAEGVLVDPGAEAGRLEQALRAAGKRPALILATHAHYDHVGAVHALASAFGAPFACGRSDQEILDSLEEVCAFYGLGPTQVPKVERWLEGGETLPVAGMELEVLATPGHSPGSLCFLHRPSLTLFSGDTLFHQSVGRADLPGGDPAALEASVRGRLYSLPEEVKVLPGHGPATSIAHERRANPYIRP